MDINKIQLYSISNNDVTSRVDLLLDEDDTVSLKIENPLNTIAYPVLSVSYKLTYTQNALFIENKNFYLVMNGCEILLDYLDSSYSEENVDISFLLKSISIIDVIKDEIFSKFFDTNGNPIMQTIVPNGNTFVVPRIAGKIEDKLMSYSFDSYTVVNNTVFYIAENEIISEEAVAVWNDKNIDVFNTTKGTNNRDFSALAPELGDLIIIRQFNEITKDIYKENRITTQVISTSQFAISADNSKIENIIPNECYINCTSEMIEITVFDYTFLIPCILLCKEYYMQATHNIYQRGWYIFPLLSEVFAYVKHVTVEELPSIEPEQTTTIFTPEYKFTVSPLKYYNIGDDINNTMFNSSVNSDVNGKWTPIVFTNEQLSVYNIISDVCYRKMDTLKDNDNNDDLSIYSLTKMKIGLNSTSYKYKASDLKTKNVNFIDNDGFNLVEINENSPSSKLRVVQWTNCVPPINIYPASDLIGYRKVPLLTTCAKNYKDNKYDIDGELIKPNDNILQYNFEGYLSTIGNTTIDNYQNIIPKTLLYNNTIFYILSISNYNLRSGYIRGICYLIRN